MEIAVVKSWLHGRVPEPLPRPKKAMVILALVLLPAGRSFSGGQEEKKRARAQQASKKERK